MQLSKEEIAALDYFSSDETQKKYELLAVKDSSIVILEGNDTVFIKQNNTTDFIDSIKSELPRRKIKFSGNIKGATAPFYYSTVTDFARFLGLSISLSSSFAA